MKKKLSLLMITKDSEDLLEKVLSSVKDLVDEMVIIDSISTDNTVLIAKKFGAKVYNFKNDNLGEKRAFGLKKAIGPWILAIDADEVVTKELAEEIKKVVQSDVYTGYEIPFQCHYLGRAVNYGGENHKKLRLFLKDKVMIKPVLIHERFEIKSGKMATLKNKLYHYGYRSLNQVFRKFTEYGLREAQQKISRNEKSSFKKIFIYPIHMFWARFIKDKGYKDGMFRIPLDLGFVYMEFLTYFSMIFIR
jgi:glycosyltransferase involved in cell wall biosynthesis